MRPTVRPAKKREAFMINYTLEKRFQNVTLPPEKPEETYPDDGPPPLTSMMNVTIQPNVFFFF